MAKAYYNRGLTYAKLNPPQHKEAIHDYTEAIKLYKEDNDKAKAYINRGISYGELNPPQYKDAIADYSQAIQLSKDDNLKALAEDNLKLIDKAQRNKDTGTEPKPKAGKG